MKVQTITEQLLFSTVRIETDQGVGTGFLLQAQIQFGGSFIFLITNKHVVKDVSTIKFFFTKGKEVISIEKDKKKIKVFSKKREEQTKEMIPHTGERYECQLNGQEWFDHPDSDIDLTLINLSPILNKIHKEDKIFIKTIPLELIPSKETIEELDALENVLFIGYPSGIYDKKNLLPIIRRGITATPIYSDYEGKPIFLIDASVFKGSSGSPVFVYDKGSFKTRDGTTHIGDRIFFCGVISDTIIKKESGKIEFIEVPTKILPILETGQMIDLGIVIKSEKVKELLDLYLDNLNKENREKNKNE
ncbi:MAG: trypsin-like peptidase domain-containing protein [Nanoarchaeota archaeon]